MAHPSLVSALVAFDRLARRRRFGRGLAIALCVALGPAAFAQTLTWTGAFDGATFGTAGNWSPAVAPGPTHDCVIPAGPGSVIVQNNANIRSLSTSRAMLINGCCRVGLGADLILNNGVTFTIDNTGGCTGFYFSGGTHAIAGSGSIFIQNEGIWGEALRLDAGATVSIGSDILVNLGPGAASTKAKITVGAGCILVNNGTIASSRAGSSLTIDGPGEFTNQGIVRCDQGGQLFVQSFASSNIGRTEVEGATVGFANAWTNGGVISLIDAVASFDGTYSSLGEIEASGGTIRMSGTYTGAALTARGGEIQFDTISMNGTTLHALEGSTFRVNGAATMNNCSLDGTMIIGNCARMLVSSGFSFLPGSMIIIDDTCNETSPNFLYNAIEFTGGTQSLSGSGILRIKKPYVRGNTAPVHLQNATVLTVEPGVTIDTDPTQNWSVLTTIRADAGCSLINRGTITANRPGSTLVFEGAGVLTNYGEIVAAPNSIITLGLAGLNEGAIRADHARLEIAGLSRNAGLIQTSASTVYGVYQTTAMENLGIISFDSGSVFEMGWYGFVNEGQLIADASAITIRSLITTAGTLALNNSTCILEQSYASLGSILRSGGSLTLKGSFTGAELLATSATGDLILDQLSLTGTTLRSTGSGRLVPISIDMTACTIASDLSFAVCRSSAVHGGLTLANSARITFETTPGCDSSRLEFSGGVQQLAGTGSLTALNGLTAPLSVASNTTLTIGSDIAVRFGPGSGTINNGTLSVEAGALLINQGRIENLQTGKTLTIADPGTFQNAGTLAATAGAVVVENLSGSVGDMQIAPGISLTLAGTYTIDHPITVSAGGKLTLNGTWTNTSTITATNATFVLGGTWTNSGLFAVDHSAWTIGGIYTSIGATTGSNNALTYNGNFPGSVLIADASTGDIALTGLHKNKTFKSAAGAKFLVPPNGVATLDGCVLDSDLRVQTCGSVTISNGLTLQNGVVLMIAAGTSGCGRSPLQFTGAAETIGGTGTIQIDSAGSAATLTVSALVTFGPDVEIRFDSDASTTTDITMSISTTRSITLQGKMFAAKAGRSLVISGSGTFVNQGTVECRAGTISINPTFISNYTSSTATLSGGIWRAKGGTILLGSRPIRVIAAGTEVEMDQTLIGVTILSTLTSNSGTLRLASRSLSITPVGGTFSNSGTLELGTGGALNVNGSISLQPSGTFRVLAAGLSIGQVGIVSATGNATLAGPLTGAFQSPYSPVAGEVLPAVVKAASISGAFSSACFDSNPFLLGVQPVIDLISVPNAANLLVTADAGLFPTIATQPMDSFARPDAGFGVDAGPADASYAWRRNGQVLVDGPTGSGSTIAGSQTNQLSILLAKPADAGDYDVVISNGCGTATSDLAKLITCPGDLNGDGLVDDADFLIFVAGYNILDCADPAMPANCPADIDGNEVADDADFSIFVVAYNELLCP